MKRNLIIIIIAALITAGFIFSGMIREDIGGKRGAIELPEALTYDAARLIEQDQIYDDSALHEEAREVIDGEMIDTGPLAPPVSSRSDSSAETVRAVPTQYNLAVPFQSQAPYANWEMPYKEACEESSLIMANAFFKGQSLSPEKMDASILALVKWENDTFGYYADTNAKEVARIATEYFGLNAVLEYDVSVDQIKKHLSQNKLVLVPAAGRMLGNPYFTGEGPIYHMLVIRGYTQERFITNDPGTRHGEAYTYSYDVLLNAIHDWPRAQGGDHDLVTEKEMESGQKVMIVVDL